MSFKNWYDENKGKLADRRKKKYESDEEYRQKRLDEAKRYYWLKRRRSELIDAKRIELDELELKPDLMEEIQISNPDDIRFGETVCVPMYAIASVAKLLGRSVQTLRMWSLNGLFPEATHRLWGGKRFYTEDQYKLMAVNRHLLEYPSKDFSENPFFVVVKKGWEDFGKDGIEVMDKNSWRFDPTVCQWCGSSPSLQTRTLEGKKWVPVPCFSCDDPVDGGKTVTIRGVCSCGNIVVQEVPDVGNPVVLCDRCGQKVKEFKQL